MKFLSDYFPIICFFIVYKFYGIFSATAVAMLASVLQIGLYWLITRRFEKLHVIMLASVLVLGGATLLFHNAVFIQWKPSILYWGLGLVLIGSHYMSKKSLMCRLLSDRIELPEKVWGHISVAWGTFFILLGSLNLYVVYHYSTDTWVNFKLFGGLGFTLLFALLQAVYLSFYLKENRE